MKCMTLWCYREQRVTGIAIFLFIGISVMLTSVLKVSHTCLRLTSHCT